MAKRRNKNKQELNVGAFLGSQIAKNNTLPSAPSMEPREERGRGGGSSTFGRGGSGGSFAQAGASDGAADWSRGQRAQAPPRRGGGDRSFGRREENTRSFGASSGGFGRRQESSYASRRDEESSRPSERRNSFDSAHSGQDRPESSMSERDSEWRVGAGRAQEHIQEREPRKLGEADQDSEWRKSSGKAVAPRMEREASKWWCGVCVYLISSVCS